MTCIHMIQQQSHRCIAYVRIFQAILYYWFDDEVSQVRNGKGAGKKKQNRAAKQELVMD